MTINHKRTVSTEPLAVLCDGLDALLDVIIAAYPARCTFRVTSPTQQPLSLTQYTGHCYRPGTSTNFSG